jgi:hypothetical protein
MSAAAAYRALLRAVTKRLTLVSGNTLWRDAVRSEFRAAAAERDPVAAAAAVARAEDLALSINAVNDHKARSAPAAALHMRVRAAAPRCALHCRRRRRLTRRAAAAGPAGFVRHQHRQRCGGEGAREAHSGARRPRRRNVGRARRAHQGAARAGRGAHGVSALWRREPAGRRLQSCCGCGMHRGVNAQEALEDNVKLPADGLQQGRLRTGAPRGRQRVFERTCVYMYGRR